jgi:UPF0176 protein
MDVSCEIYYSMRKYNHLNTEDLKKRLASEAFERQTMSFYRYVSIAEPENFRNKLFEKLSSLECLGRIYIAREGINAQMNFPVHHRSSLMEYVDLLPELQGVPIKWAVQDHSESFYKLIVKVRKKIVADGLDDDAFDTANVGKHLTATEFHKAMDQPDSVVVDMRNNYESEVGRFANAICPDAVTFREELNMVTTLLEDKKDAPVLLYCTGGVRCEKASAYLKHHGFKNVSQLYGGIIDYARQIRETGERSRFIGKNFVFDNRMGERITEEVIAQCHQCGIICDTHVNCANDQCHMLFIQCDTCASKYQGCCSDECVQILRHPPEEIQKKQPGKKWRRRTGEIIRL